MVNWQMQTVPVSILPMIYGDHMNMLSIIKVMDSRSHVNDHMSLRNYVHY